MTIRYHCTNRYGMHDDVIKWKHFPRYWPFVRGIHRWILLTKVSDAELLYFLWSAPEQTVEQTIETRVIWDAIVLIMTSLEWIHFLLMKKIFEIFNGSFMIPFANWSVTAITWQFRKQGQTENIFLRYTFFSESKPFIFGAILYVKSTFNGKHSKTLFYLTNFVDLKSLHKANKYHLYSALFYIVLFFY